MRIRINQVKKLFVIFYHVKSFYNIFSNFLVVRKKCRYDILVVCHIQKTFFMHSGQSPLKIFYSSNFFSHMELKCEKSVKVSNYVQIISGDGILIPSDLRSRLTLILNALVCQSPYFDLTYFKFNYKLNIKAIVL